MTQQRVLLFMKMYSSDRKGWMWWCTSLTGCIWTDSTVRMVDLSSRSAWPTLQVLGLHDRTLSKRGGRRERQRLPKNVKNKSCGGKNIFSPPTRDVGYKEVAFLTTKQTTVSSQEAILTRICVYFSRSIRTIGLSWGGGRYILKRTGEIVSFSSTYFSK